MFFLRKLKNRNLIVLSFLLFWAVVMTAHLFYYTVIEKDKYVALGNEIAWREGRIPAPRGKIYDKNGVLLAWNEIFYDLKLEQLSPARALYISSAMRKVMPKLFPDKLENSIKAVKTDFISELVVKKVISPEDITKLERFIEEYPELKIRQRIERAVVDYPEVKAFIGKTEKIKGSLKGVSGVELRHDKSLKGKDQIYTFMLDRSREWIPGTWKVKEEMIPGKDLKLDVSLEEIRSGKKTQVEDE